MLVFRNLNLYIILLFFLPYISVAISESAHQQKFDVGKLDQLNLSLSLRVANSPGTNPGTVVLSERVFIKGLHRLPNLHMFSYGLKLNFSFSPSGIRRPIVEICLHSNASIGIGMMSRPCWEKIEKSSWTRLTSPFGFKILDIRVSGPSAENFKILSSLEFSSYRVVFLVVGFFLWCAAFKLSKSLVFYYSNAILVGVLLVVLVILFQGMKLLPTGRRNSLAIFLYTSFVGFGTFLLRFIPGMFQSLLVEMGLNEDMHYPLACILVVCVFIAGAWMGFLAMRKLVLTENGSVDSTTSQFVGCSIRFFASVMIIQASLDPLIDIGFLITTIVYTEFVLKFWHHLYKATKRFIRKLFKKISRIDLSKHGLYSEKHLPETPPRSNSFRGEKFIRDSPKSPSGYRNFTPHRISEPNFYLSSFHNTPERRNLSRHELRESTKKSTKLALAELYSSPEFTSWVAANGDRLTVTPESKRSSVQRRRRWFALF